MVLLASGSEVWVALAARELLEAEDIPTQVVSLPCWELFEAQEASYREEILPAGAVRVAVEAASPFGWSRWVGEDGDVVAMHRFGACGQGTEVLERFGFTPQHVADVARGALLRAGSRGIQPPVTGPRA
jgi:transketolase